jgi:bifunctional enzyme CysN/CysC
MVHSMAETDAFAAFLAENEGKDLLRFLTCGSVDDGKSTLIGRLLYDSKKLFEDQLATLQSESAKFGTTEGDIDFALLVDGLVAEREQGITIDVAYRYFATDRRRFIVADTPGHEQYTRNMATGASNSDLAVLLVDAQQGILTQTRRHAYIVSLLGIRNVVLAVNKIDLIGFDEERFIDIRNAFAEFAAQFKFETIVTIPLSARFGDNVIEKSARTPWYGGPTLLGHLETVRVEDGTGLTPLRFPVQWVNRPNAGFRGYAGTLASGSVRPGDKVVVARTGQAASVSRIVTLDGDLEKAESGMSVTITLDTEIDASRGDIFGSASATSPPASRSRSTRTRRTARPAPSSWSTASPTALPARAWWPSRSAGRRTSTMSTSRWTRRRALRWSATSPWCCGSPACRGRANPPLRTSSNANWRRPGAIRCCSTATISARA